MLILWRYAIRATLFMHLVVLEWEKEVEEMQKFNI